MEQRTQKTNKCGGQSIESEELLGEFMLVKIIAFIIDDIYYQLELL